MAEEKIDLLVEGGNAKPDASVAQRLGPLKINIGQVMQDINAKTIDFNGMKVPVKVIVNTNTKDVKFTIGTPPVSELIKKEFSVAKGSAQPNNKKIANIGIEQVIKIAKMKQDSMLSRSLKASVKTIIGSCNAMGILVEGKNALEINEEIEQGNYNKEIESESTELNPDKTKMLKQQLEIIQYELKKELEKEKALEKELESEVKIDEPKEAEKGAETKDETKKEVKDESKETASEEKSDDKKEEKKE